MPRKAQSNENNLVLMQCLRLLSVSIEKRNKNKSGTCVCLTRNRSDMPFDNYRIYCVPVVLLVVRTYRFIIASVSTRKMKNGQKTVLFFLSLHSCVCNVHVCVQVPDHLVNGTNSALSNVPFVVFVGPIDCIHNNDATTYKWPEDDENTFLHF